MKTHCSTGKPTQCSVVTKMGRQSKKEGYLNRFLRPASPTQLEPQERAPRDLIFNSLTRHPIQRPFLQESLPSSIPLMLCKKYPAIFNSCT